MKNHVQHVLGALSPTPPATTSALTASSPSRAEMVERLKYSVLPGIAGAAAGYYFWKKHCILGALGGLAVGAAAYPVITGKKRLEAGTALAATGVGIAASLKWKRHPALGYIGGTLATSLVAAPLALKAFKKA